MMSATESSHHFYEITTLGAIVEFISSTFLNPSCFFLTNTYYLPFKVRFFKKENSPFSHPLFSSGNEAEIGGKSHYRF